MVQFIELDNDEIQDIPLFAMARNAWQCGLAGNEDSHDDLIEVDGKNGNGWEFKPRSQRQLGVIA